MKKVVSVALVLMMVFSLVACGGTNTTSTGGTAEAPAKKVSLTMSCVGTETGIDYQTSVAFAEKVKEKSNGAIEITVYGNDQLANGDSNKGMTMLATGQVDFGSYACSVLANINPKMGVCTMPFTFANYDEVNKYYGTTAGEYCAEVLSESGITWMDYTHNAIRQLSNSKHEVRTPADLKGLKIRVPGGTMFAEIWACTEADAMAMSWAEVYTALQQKTIDGQENGFKTSKSNSIQDVNKFFTVWNYVYDAYPLLANTANLSSKLSEDQVALVLECAKEVCAESRAQNEQEEKDIMKEFEDKYGVTVSVLTEEEINAFRELTKPVVEAHRTEYGDAYAAFGIK